MSTSSQRGLLGEDHEPGRYTAEELTDLTGVNPNARLTKLPKTEHQDTLFDVGKKTDLPDQRIMFDSLEE